MRRWFREGAPGAVTDCFIFLMLLVFPLFTGIIGYDITNEKSLWGYTDITREKSLFFLCLTGLWILTLAAACVVTAVKGRWKPPKLRLPQIFVLAFMLVACLSAAFSPYGAEVLLGAEQRYEGLAALLCFGAIFLGVSWFGRLRPAHVLAFGASVSVCCAVAILQLLNLNPLWLFPQGLRYHDAHILYTSEFLGTIGNTDLLSAFLCLAVPFFTALIVRRGGRAWILLLPAALGVFVLVESGVSGGAVALALAFLVGAPVLAEDGVCFRRLCHVLLALCVCVGFALGCVWPDGREVGAFALKFGVASLAAFGAATLLAVLGLLPDMLPKAMARPRKAVVICIVCVSVLGVAALWFYPGQSGTLYEFSRVLHGDPQDSFGSSRILIWREVLGLVRQRPLLGGGPGTLGFRLDVTFTRYIPETGKTLSTYADNAHNEFLGYLANIGVPGLLAYLGAGIVSLPRFFKRRTAGVTALGAAVLCYWIQSFFGLGLCFVTPLMWLLWGLFCSDRSADADAGARAEKSLSPDLSPDGGIKVITTREDEVK